MEAGRFDKLPPDVDHFVDWVVPDLEYDIEQQTLAFAAAGPEGVDRRVACRFRRVVYLEVWSDWRVMPWRQTEALNELNEGVLSFVEAPELAVLHGSLARDAHGVAAERRVGAEPRPAGRWLAPPDASLRAFVLTTDSLTLQRLCGEVEVRVSAGATGRR